MVKNKNLIKIADTSFKHKFRNHFQNALNPICSCKENIETTAHYPSHCPSYLMNEWHSYTTFRILKKIFVVEMIPDFLRCFFFDDFSFYNTKNTSILNAIIQYPANIN